MKKIFALIFTIMIATVFSCQKDSSSEGTSVPGDQDEDNTTATIDESYRYQLPVIFHVLYSDKNDPNQYVPYARIKEILQNVNELWKGGFYDSQSLGLSQDMGVDFVLATVDEDGNRLAQPGVEYVEYTSSYPIDPYTFLDTKSNKKYMWEPNEYINIILFNFKTDEEDNNIVLGVSNMPFTYKDNNTLEGLQTISYKSYSKNNLSYCYSSCINSLFQSRDYESNRYSYYKELQIEMGPRDINNTIAHELGHYLGLFHVFTEAKGDDGSEPVDSCGDTDYCSDTKSYNYFTYQTFLSQMLSRNDANKLTMDDLAYRTNCDGDNYNATNFMDYWVCYNTMFTPEQKKRVRHVLYYSPLIPGPKLNSPSSSTRADDDNYILPKPKRTFLTRKQTSIKK